jgi:L-galactose dehydrogenase/L-glyceraldehyde 3-phosphate reductase
MEYRELGRTGLEVSTLGFGCGNVGGLLIRGSAAERERAVARGIELGINYFDTAPIYGDGQSETNLGQAIRALKARVIVGTKVRVPSVAPAELPAAITRGLEESLGRLGMERVDLLQLHNPVTLERSGRTVSAADVRDAVVPALARLTEQGKIGFFGITAIGDTPAVLQTIDAGAIHTAQVCFNLLNPSAGHPLPPGFPAQDFERLLAHCGRQRVGVIGIRVLAGGALSGTEARHPVAAPSVEPIASGPDYAADARRARMLGALVDEGHVTDLVEASLRFAISADTVSTVLLGYSSLEQLDYAAACVARGPLESAALARLPALWEEVAGARA